MKNLLRINGNWEPKMFLKRRGDGTSVDIDSMWEHIHSDAYIKHLQEIGANVSHIHFHKGYGLEAEADSIYEAKLWAEKLHKAGIKVGVYIGSTFFMETFNHLDRDKMLVKNEVSGWNAAQYFRKHWCYNSSVAINYFKEVIRVAIEDVKADILHFDAAFASKIDQLCHCEYCLEGFKKFITEEIPEIADIAGFNDPLLLSPPPCGNREYLASVNELNEPGIIAWTLFHAQAGFDALDAVCKYSRSIKDDILIFYNGCQLAGNTRYSRPDMALEKLSLVDMSCTEDSNENPVYTTDSGIPVSRFRAYKAGYRSQTGICYYTVTNGEDNKLMLAEAAAFNYNSLGFIETAMQQNHKLEDPGDIKFINHLIDHESSFIEQTQWHNVAVLRHHESMLLNQFPCSLTPYIVEQFLFEEHIPFSIINSNDITKEKLADFAVLILPDSKSLSDYEISVIENFVANGGHLISIGNSGTATNLNQFRSEWGLSKIFNCKKSPFIPVMKYDEVAVSTAESAQLKTSSQDNIVAEYGRGKATHIPSLEFDLPDNASTLNTFGGFKWYYHPYWKPAKNIHDLLSALKSMLIDKMHIETNLPRHAGVEFYKTQTGALRLHIVNYRHPELISNATIEIHNEFADNIKIKAEYLTENSQAEKILEVNNGKLLIPMIDFSLMETVEISGTDL